MFNLTIHTLEITVLALLAFASLRVYSLSRNEFRQLDSTSAGTLNRETPSHDIDNEHITVSRAPTRAANIYEQKIESLKEAQIFAGIQLIPIKREFPDLLDSQLIWLREAISLYLIGATELIAKQSQCDEKTQYKLTSLVLSSNLKLNEFELRAAITRAAKPETGSDEHEMILAGAKAAKEWLEKNDVPSQLRLRVKLNDWGVFA